MANFKLMITLEEYKAMNPVYPLEVPEYLASEIGMSLEEYFTNAMTTAQRLVNSYMQDVLANADWDIKRFEPKTQDAIKYILFKQMEYMHQNQLFFKKVNSISYQTSGQQSFTFNPENSEINDSLIPQYVKQAIINTNLLTKAYASEDDFYDYEQQNNEFLDGYIVTDVNWGDKADNTVTINGQTNSLFYFVNFLSTDYLSSQNQEVKKLFKLAEIFSINETNLITSKKLTSNSYLSNKLPNDFAQVQDLIDTFYANNESTSHALAQIAELSNQVNTLNSTKLNTSEFNNAVEKKADVNLANVNMGTQTIPKFIQVSTSGDIILSDTSGNLTPIPWTPEYEFIQGDACSVFIEPKSTAENPKVRIFIAKEANQNKNPIQYPKIWYEYDIKYEVIESITKKEATKLFVAKENPIVENNLDMNNFSIVNCNNLIDKSSIDDSLTSTTNLWSSSKIVEYVNQNANNAGSGTNLNKYKNSDGNIDVDNISNLINLSNEIKVDTLNFMNIENREVNGWINEEELNTNLNSYNFSMKCHSEKLEWLKTVYLKEGPNFNPLNLSVLIRYYDYDKNELLFWDLAKDLHSILKLKDKNQILGSKIDSLENLYNILIEKLRTLRPFENAGVYSPDKTYNENQWVFNDGDVYVSIIDNNDEPLSNEDAWFHWDIQINLDNFITDIQLQEATNNLKAIIDEQEISINHLTEQVDLKQNKLIAGNNCEITPQNIINVIIPDSITPLAFRKGEIKLFDTLENWDEIVKKYKLTVDVDFSYLDDDRYLRIKKINKNSEESDIKGGEDIITKNHIKKFYTKHEGNGRMILNDPNTAGGSNTWFSSRRNSEETKIPVGVDNPTPFLPKYQSILAIRFLKDIKEVVSVND